MLLSISISSCLLMKEKRSVKIILYCQNPFLVITGWILKYLHGNEMKSVLSILITSCREGCLIKAGNMRSMENKARHYWNLLRIWSKIADDICFLKVCRGVIRVTCFLNMSTEVRVNRSRFDLDMELHCCERDRWQFVNLKAIKALQAWVFGKQSKIELMPKTTSNGISQYLLNDYLRCSLNAKAAHISWRNLMRLCLFHRRGCP